VIKNVIKLLCPDLIAAYHRWQFIKIFKTYKSEKSKYGFKFIGPDQMISGNFENEEAALIIDLAKKVDTFVDVGANIGYYTCLARTFCNHVIAIEPCAENLKFLYENLVANHWENVEVLPLGLSDKPGLANLYGGGTSASLVKRWAGTSELVKKTAPLSTLDLILRNRFVGKKSFIKIDVEGEEYNLLRGAEETLAVNPAPVWLIEICLTENQPGIINKKFKETFEIFWRNGYKSMVADISSKEISREDVDRWVKNQRTDFGNINYLFKKNNPTKAK